MVGSHGRSKQHRRAFLKSATVGTLATRMARRTDRAQAWQDDTASVVRSPVERIAPDELDESLRGIELVEFWYDPALAERAPHPIYAAIPNPDYDVFADLQGPHTGHERVTLAVKWIFALLDVYRADYVDLPTKLSFSEKMDTAVVNRAIAMGVPIVPADGAMQEFERKLDDPDFTIPVWVSKRGKKNKYALVPSLREVKPALGLRLAFMNDTADTPNVLIGGPGSDPLFSYGLSVTKTGQLRMNVFVTKELSLDQIPPWNEQQEADGALSSLVFFALEDIALNFGREDIALVTSSSWFKYRVQLGPGFVTMPELATLLLGPQQSNGLYYGAWSIHAALEPRTT